MRKHGLTRRGVGARGSFELMGVARGTERAVVAQLRNEPAWSSPSRTTFAR